MKLYLMFFISVLSISFINAQSSPIIYEWEYFDVESTPVHNIYTDQNQEIITVAGFDSQGRVHVSEYSNGKITFSTCHQFDASITISSIKILNKEKLIVVGNNKKGRIIFYIIHPFTGKRNKKIKISKKIKGQVNSLLFTPQGILLAGLVTKENEENEINHDMMVSMVSNRGRKKWHTEFGSPIGADNALSTIQDGQAGFIVVGSSDDYNIKKNDAFILRLTSNGEHDWEKKYSDVSHSIAIHKVALHNNNKILGVGTFDDQIIIMVLDEFQDIDFLEHLGSELYRYTINHISSMNKTHRITGHMIDKVTQKEKIYTLRINSVE